MVMVVYYIDDITPDGSLLAGAGTIVVPKQNLKMEIASRILG